MTSAYTVADQGAVGRARLARWADRLDRHGGFSVSVYRQWDVTSGYALSLHPECERVIQGRVTDQDLLDYILEHAAPLLRDGNVFGAWRDPDTGLSYLDVSAVVHDRAEALRLAREHNQLAIFDVARGIEIRA